MVFNPIIVAQPTKNDKLRRDFMLLGLLFTDPLNFLAIAAALVLALSWHEAAHAFAARQLGDDTAERLGRLTLNPLAHLDPLGTLAILIAGVGWGKPVPVDVSNFRYPKLDNLKVALAGPISNFILALFFAGLGLIFRPDPGSLAGIFTGTVIWINLILMLFNLLPIPPLDGSKILHLLVDNETFFKIEQYGFFILFGLIALSWAGIPILSFLIFTPAKGLFSLLTGGGLPSLF